MQIKIFGGYESYFDLQCVVNEWLAENEHTIQVQDVFFSNGTLLITYTF